MPRCRPSVGFIATARDAVLAEVLFDFSDDDVLAGRPDSDLQALLNLRQLTGLELDVEHRSDDLNDLAERCRRLRCLLAMVFIERLCAPETTFDDFARDRCLTDLVHRESGRAIISAEFLVAVSIAVICAPRKNAAFDSKQRPVDLHLDVAGQQLVEDLLGGRLSR